MNPLPLSLEYLKRYGLITSIAPSKTQGVVECMNVSCTQMVRVRVHLGPRLETTGLTRLPVQWVALRA